MQQQMPTIAITITTAIQHLITIRPAMLIAQQQMLTMVPERVAIARQAKTTLITQRQLVNNTYAKSL